MSTPLSTNAEDELTTSSENVSTLDGTDNQAPQKTQKDTEQSNAITSCISSQENIASGLNLVSQWTKRKKRFTDRSEFAAKARTDLVGIELKRLEKMYPITTCFDSELKYDLMIDTFLILSLSGAFLGVEDAATEFKRLSRLEEIEFGFRIAYNKNLTSNTRVKRLTCGTAHSMLRRGQTQFPETMVELAKAIRITTFDQSRETIILNRFQTVVESLASTLSETQGWISRYDIQRKLLDNYVVTEEGAVVID